MKSLLLVWGQFIDTDWTVEENIKKISKWQTVWVHIQSSSRTGYVDKLLAQMKVIDWIWYIDVENAEVLEDWEKLAQENTQAMIDRAKEEVEAEQSLEDKAE